MKEAIHVRLAFQKKESFLIHYKRVYKTLLNMHKQKKIDVLLSYQSEHVLLRVKDNGVGFSLFESMVKAKHEPHYGILHMNEQAEQLGATFRLIVQ